MYKATVNDKIITIEANEDGTFLQNGLHIAPDWVEIKPGVFHVILDNVSYNAEIVRMEAPDKLVHVRVGSNIYKVQLRDKYDELLKALGMDNNLSKKVPELKAPMPGLVVEVAVSEGQEIKKGDRLVVLEAMKMENILKAPADAVIRKVNVIKGKTVEKNEVLVSFV